MKSNREVLSDIETALLKRPLNDREKEQRELELRQRERDKMMYEIKMSLTEGAHQEKLRMINSGILYL